MLGHMILNNIFSNLLNTCLFTVNVLYSCAWSSDWS